jgi:hypothetical protein
MCTNLKEFPRKCAEVIPVSEKKENSRSLLLHRYGICVFQTSLLHTRSVFIRNANGVTLFQVYKYITVKLQRLKDQLKHVYN